MNILWLAPIPIINNKDTHPAPWVMTLATALVENGHSLTIINYNSNIEKKKIEINYKNIKLVYLKTPKLKLNFLTLYRLKIKIVREYLKNIITNFDILHIHGTEHQYEVMAHDLKIPKVVSIQGIMNECIKYVPRYKIKQLMEWKLSALYESFYIPKNKYYSCRTKWDSEIIGTKNPKAKIYMIWEMIRNEFFTDHFSTIKKNILFVGGKNEIKGLSELLIAYNNSLQKLGLKLIILGKCGIKDIQKIIFEKELKYIDIDNIDCRGMQDTSGMLKAYDDSFCLVHPTYIDNSPNSVCEAQIAGLPVIATAVGGVPSLIDDRITGIIISNDVREIEKAVVELYSDDDLWSKISETSKSVARSRHDPEKILDQTLVMYKEIIEESK